MVLTEAPIKTTPIEVKKISEEQKNLQKLIDSRKTELINTWGLQPHIDYCRQLLGPNTLVEPAFYDYQKQIFTEINPYAASEELKWHTDLLQCKNPGFALIIKPKDQIDTQGNSWVIGFVDRTENRLWIVIGIENFITIETIINRNAIYKDKYTEDLNAAIQRGYRLLELAYA